MPMALSIVVPTVSAGTRGDTWTPESCQHLGVSFVTWARLSLSLARSPVLPSYTHTHTYVQHTPGSANIIYDFFPKFLFSKLP